jgi:predicted nuclease of restriction endonuclease-like RecB superfamily
MGFRGEMMAAWGRRGSFYGKSSDGKFGNKRSQCSLGHSHRSKLESAVCAEYQQRARIDNLVLTCESHVYLTDAHILYIPDFKLRAIDGTEFYGESKGFETPEWRIKKRLWEHYGPAPLEIWKGSHSNPKLVEVITPPVKKT